jgi:hypothetical protein
MVSSIFMVRWSEHGVCSTHRVVYSTLSCHGQISTLVWVHNAPLYIACGVGNPVD